MQTKSNKYNPASDPRFSAAMRAHVAGKLDEALNGYLEILKDISGSPDLHHALGALYMQQQNIAESITHFEKAYALAPSARFGGHLVHAQKSAGLNQEAAVTLAALASADPGDHKLFTEFFNTCVEAQRFDLPTQHIERILPSRKNDMLLHALLVFLYERQDRHIDKIPHMEFMWKAEPKQAPEFYVNYVKALRMAQRLEEADEVIDAGLAHHPKSSDLLSLKAGSMHLEGNMPEALKYYERALQADPENGRVKAAIGIVKMMMSDLKEGYAEYSYRPNLDTLGSKLEGCAPRWCGQQSNGKKLLLWTEQGIGDIVMFASLLPWVMQKGPEITCIVVPKMIPLLKRSFPNVTFVSTLHIAGTTDMGPAYDFQLPMGELMGMALPVYTPSEHAPFLKADPEKTAKLREKYLAGGAKKLVGISWHTKNDETAYIRNIPLAQWEPLYDVPGVQCVSLQYGDHAAEIASMNGKVLADPAVDALNDIDALAAQMAAMDAVVSIQNATVHMAGGLGVPCTLMLNAASDWRWGMGASENRWYKSVRVERQETLLQWQPVLERIAKRLA